MSEIYDKLVELSKSEDYPFHMPGHKRNLEAFEESVGKSEKSLIQSMYTDNLINSEDLQEKDFDDSPKKALSEICKLDITEIDGFDNLHFPEGLIKLAEERANRLYKADETFFLINGSTCGVLSGVMAATKYGDKILVQRNSHKSLYNAAYLNNLCLEYFECDVDQEYGYSSKVDPKAIEDKLKECRDVSAVFITSPSYEGVPSDVEAISEIVHGYGIPLIVDEAHGAHFGFDSRVPIGAIEQGADIVIHSVHKTLPSMTQTALLHVQGNFVDVQRIKRYLGIFQSSSPSYVLMASIDNCMDFLDLKKDDWFNSLIDFREFIEQRTKCCEFIKVLDLSKIPDPCKIVITSEKRAGIDGKQLYSLLREKYHLQPEMASFRYVLMILTGNDTKLGVERLVDAIIDINKTIKEDISQNEQVYRNNEANYNYVKDKSYKREYNISEALDADYAYNEMENSVGKISADFVFLYPPGSPLIVPGEVVTEEFVKTVRKAISTNLDVKGLNDKNQIKIMK